MSKQMTHQQLYMFCKLFNNMQEFTGWLSTYTQKEKDKMFPTLDHYQDCVNAIKNQPGHSIYL